MSSFKTLFSQDLIRMLKKNYFCCSESTLGTDGHGAPKRLSPWVPGKQHRTIIYSRPKPATISPARISSSFIRKTPPRERSRPAKIGSRWCPLRLVSCRRRRVLVYWAMNRIKVTTLNRIWITWVNVPELEFSPVRETKSIWTGIHKIKKTMIAKILKTKNSKRSARPPFKKILSLRQVLSTNKILFIAFSLAVGGGHQYFNFPSNLRLKKFLPL